jgi:peptidoglycan/LPS O-acetylase OafA/YrhL
MNPTLDVTLHFSLLFCAMLVYVLNRRNHNAFLRLAFLYIVITALFDGIAAAIMLTDFLSGIVSDNLFVYHILTPVQYTIIVLMFRNVIRNKNIKVWMLRSIPLFWLVAIFLTLFVQPLNDYSTYSLLLKYVLITPIVLYYLVEILNAPDEYELTREPAFWIGTGFLFHSIGNVFAQGISNEFIKYSSPLFTILNTVSSILNYVLFLCFIIAFLSKPKAAGRERNLRSY